MNSSDRSGVEMVLDSVIDDNKALSEAMLEAIEILRQARKVLGPGKTSARIDEFIRRYGTPQAKKE